MAEKDAHAAAKEQQQKGAELKAKSVEEAYAHQGKPTPTQEENDLAKLGVPIEQHEDDGSGPQPEFRMSVERRQSEANKPSGGGYATRSVSPSKPATPSS